MRRRFLSILMVFELGVCLVNLCWAADLARNDAIKKAYLGE